MSVSTVARPLSTSLPVSPQGPPAGAPRSAPRPSSSPAPVRPRLTVVPDLPVRPARTPFVLLLCGLLGLGLLTLLMLNMVLAQDAFAVHDLEARKARLEARTTALEQQLARETAPQRLARRAAALGLVASEGPAFVRQSDRQVLGAPAPARAGGTSASAVAGLAGGVPPLLAPLAPPLVSDGPAASVDRPWVLLAPADRARLAVERRERTERTSRTTPAPATVAPGAAGPR